MLSLLLAASMGGYPACQAATGYGYTQGYVATPYVQANYGYQAPAYYNKVVTAFVPINQYERTEIVGDAARQQGFAQQRLAADTSLAQALAGMTGELKSFREQVKQATQIQDQAFQARHQAQAQTPSAVLHLAPGESPFDRERLAPPVAQYPVQPSPQSTTQVQYPAPPSKSPPADYGQVPEPPQASPQVPAKGFPTLPPVNVPPPPTDMSQDQQGTFPTGPVQPQGPTGFQVPSPSGPGTFPTQPQQGFQAPSPSGPLSPAMQAATAIVGQRCGSCHGPNGSGGRVIMASKDRLASYDPGFLKMLDQVAYRGFVLTEDGRKLKMPPSGRGLDQDEWRVIHAALDEAEQSSALASNSQGNR